MFSKLAFVHHVSCRSVFGRYTLQIVKHDGTVSTFCAQGTPASQILYPSFGEMDLTKVLWLTNKLECQEKLKALNVNATVTLVTDKLTAVHFEGLQAGLNENTTL